MSKRADPMNPRRFRAYAGHKKPSLSARRGVDPAAKRREQDAIDANDERAVARELGIKARAVSPDQMTAARGGW